MMKPPLKGSKQCYKLIRALWFDMCTVHVWFVASLSMTKPDPKI